jgi:hypothetical protein
MRSSSGWLFAGLFAMLLWGCGERQRDGAAPPATPTPTPPPAPASVAGEVRLEGQPDSSGIQVYIPGTSQLSITDRAGRYLLSGIAPGEYEVAARAEGYVAASLGKVTVEPAPRPRQYTMASATLKRSAPPTPEPAAAASRLGSINGRLRSSTDEEVDWSFCSVSLDQTPYRVAAASDGSFLLWNLPPDQYRLEARMPGFEPASVAVRVLPGSAPTSVTLTLGPAAGEGGGAAGGGAPQPAATPAATSATTARVYGVAFKDEPGQADMSGITVSLAGTSLSATTDAEGKYVLENINPGNYQLIAQLEGYEPARLALELKAGDDLELEGLLLKARRNYPKVLQTTPANGARGVTVQPQIPLLVRFSKKMNPDSLRRAVRIEPEVAFQVVSGRDTDNDLMRIVLYGTGQKPIARFRTRYTLTITPVATDFEGLTLQEPFQMSFTTGAAEVIRTTPASGERGVPLAPQSPVQIFFNAPMDYNTLTADTVRIQPSLSLMPIIGHRDDPTTGWTQMLITGMWQPDTDYRITILRRVRTVGNNSLANTPYTFRFRTGKMNLIRLPSGNQFAR